MKTKLAALLLAAAPLLAQPKPVDVTVQQVNDRRSKGFFAELTIALALPKVKASEVAASRVLVRAATDDTGRDLVDKERQEPELEATMGMGPSDDAPASVRLSLKSPARNATKVKEVRGEIELFMPSKDPNSVAEVAKFVGMNGKPLSHKALKANGVEIIFLTPAQIEALQPAPSLNEGADLAVRVKDPNKRIQSVAYIDPAGETHRVIVREDEGVTIFTSWTGAPQPDWKVRVNMKTPKTVVRHAFVVKDVTLP